MNHAVTHRQAIVTHRPYARYLDRRVAVDHTEAAEDKAGRTGCNRRVAGAEHRNRTEERRMKDTASVA